MSVNSKRCKTPMCLSTVWRTGNFSYSNYCWEHDPEVKEVKQRLETKTPTNQAPLEQLLSHARYSGRGKEA